MFTAVFIMHNDIEDPFTTILKPGDTFTECDLYEADIEIAVFGDEAAAQAWLDERTTPVAEEEVTAWAAAASRGEAEEWSLSATQAYFKGIHWSNEAGNHVPTVPGTVFDPQTEQWVKA